MSKSQSRADRKMIGSAADSARSSRHSAKPPSTSAPRPMSMIASSGRRAASARERFGAVGEGRDLVAVLRERVGVVRADGGVVLDDGDAAGHGGDYSRRRARPSPLPAVCQNCSRAFPEALRHRARGPGSMLVMETNAETTAGPAASRPARPRLRARGRQRDRARRTRHAARRAGLRRRRQPAARAPRRHGRGPAGVLRDRIDRGREALRTRILAEYANPFAERLAGVYLHRLPENAMLEQLSFTLIAEDGEQLEAPVAARHALLG